MQYIDWFKCVYTTSSERAQYQGIWECSTLTYTLILLSAPSKTTFYSTSTNTSPCSIVAVPLHFHRHNKGYECSPCKVQVSFQNFSFSLLCLPALFFFFPLLLSYHAFFFHTACALITIHCTQEVWDSTIGSFRVSTASLTCTLSASVLTSL